MIIAFNKPRTKVRMRITKDDSEVDRKEWCMEATSFLRAQGLRFAEPADAFWAPKAGMHSFDIESEQK